MAGQYTAVLIQAAADCCEAVYELKDRVFLASEVPFLPLRACATPERCRCRYTKRSDRRDDDDDRRGLANAHRSVMYPGQEQRSEKRGRRDED
jgi:hypothetical protein